MGKAFDMSKINQNDIAHLTLEDVCKSSGLTIVQITEYIQEGLFEVRGDDKEHWRFSETHLVMFQKVLRLEQDLRLNPAGAVLALELMAEIENLKKRLRRTDSEGE